MDVESTLKLGAERIEVAKSQVVEGCKGLAPFDPARWELHEDDYRQEYRVFDHITSTGMISHVGPRGLVPYVRETRRRIRKDGRYVRMCCK
jgi:cyclopropane fatty-acyl-phospholipid synthase-like methyltransferase